VAGEQVTAVSELKVTEVCRVSCATQRSIYTRDWWPKTVCNSELAKRKATTLLLKGSPARSKSTVRWWSKAVNFISLLARASFPRA
jgi:hypothetical protein